MSDIINRAEEINRRMNELEIEFAYEVQEDAVRMAMWDEYKELTKELKTIDPIYFEEVSDES